MGNDDWSVETLSGKGGISLSRAPAVEMQRGENPAPSNPALAEPQGRWVTPKAPEPGWRDTVSSWASKIKHSVWGGDEKPAPVATHIMMTDGVRSLMPKSSQNVDQASDTALKIRDGLSAPAAPDMPAGATRSQIQQGLEQWLGKTMVFPPEYAQKMLNDKDGSFHKKIENLLNKQEDGDSIVRSNYRQIPPDQQTFGEGMLAGIDKFKQRWDVAPALVAPNPTVAPVIAPGQP